MFFGPKFIPCFSMAFTVFVFFATQSYSQDITSLVGSTVSPGSPGVGDGNHRRNDSGNKEKFEKEHTYVSVATIIAVAKVKCADYSWLGHDREHLLLSFLGDNGVKFSIAIKDNMVVFPGSMVKLTYMQDYWSHNYEKIFHVLGVRKYD